MRSRLRVLLFLCLLALWGFALQGCRTTAETAPGGEAFSHVVISNPYESIDWSSTEYHAANFHSHTTVSDGSMDPRQIAEAYHRQGYQVLALTDHDHLESGPGRLAHGMLASHREENLLVLIGSELSGGHHMNSLFVPHGYRYSDEQEALIDIQENRGIAFMNHPGRYRLPVGWYVDVYRRYDCLFGLEVFNRNDRYRHDRQLWDALLYHLMPERPVWALANDDSHKPKDIGYNRNILLMESLDAASVRQALERGTFYLFRPHVRGEQPRFTLRMIETDKSVIRITVEGDGHTIRWITYDPLLGKSRTISTDKELDVGSLPLSTTFVRAQINGPGGIIYTQPFGLAGTDTQSHGIPSDCCR